jgi:DNA-binding MltR family transcriptional regulator
MTKDAEAIIEKMKNSSYSDLNFDFILKLTNESERGAILIGASKVETYLENLITKILPLSDKKYTSRLFNYPGPLSSFSGKIELCFAFRIINERVYNSLTALRKIRNDAAHSDKMFSFKDLNDDLERIYDFEHKFPEAVHSQSSKLLFNWKKSRAKESLIDNNIDPEQIGFERLWSDRLPDPEVDETFQEHLRVWKLAYGLTLLCLKIEVIMDSWTLKESVD